MKEECPRCRGLHCRGEVGDGEKCVIVGVERRVSGLGAVALDAWWDWGEVGVGFRVRRQVVRLLAGRGGCNVDMVQWRL